MIHLPPRTTLTATLFPYTPLFRSCRARNLRVEILLHFPRIEGLRIVVRFLAFVGDDFRLRAVFDLVPAGAGPDANTEARMRAKTETAEPQAQTGTRLAVGTGRALRDDEIVVAAGERQLEIGRASGRERRSK